MDWLEHDTVLAAELPAWAQSATREKTLDGAPYRVGLSKEGLVLRKGGRLSAIGWSDVLVPIRLNDPARLLVAVPRRPPAPPWFEIGGLHIGEIERVVWERLNVLAEGGYRHRSPTRVEHTPDVVLTAVLARDSLPGELEIPPSTPKLTGTVVRGALFGATLGVLALPLGFGALAGLCAIGAVTGASVNGSIAYAQRRSAGRVLVLTPDAFVAGLDGDRVRAVAWSSVGRFAEGVSASRQPALEVFDSEDRLIARVGARFFGAPLDVIVAVAEAYRLRAISSVRE